MKNNSPLSAEKTMIGGAFERVMRFESSAIFQNGLKILIFTLFFSVAIFSQKLPDKIRDYKVYDAKISVKTDRNAKTEIAKKGETEATVKIGDPELTEVSLAGITFEISPEITNLGQSGTVDFLAFHDFFVNGLTVEIEEYKESFGFEKNQSVKLPKPVRIFLGASQTLRGALREIKDSKDEWIVTGKVFVFGKFKKFGFSFKRVVPVEINVKIKNPLKEHKQFSSMLHRIHDCI